MPFYRVYSFNVWGFGYLDPMQIRHDFFLINESSLSLPTSLNLPDYLHDTVRGFLFSFAALAWTSVHSLSFHRHSAEIIPKLDPLTRQAAIDSYADALRVVFICQAAINVCGFLACLPIQENALPWVLDKADFQKWCAYNRAFFRSTPSRRVPSSLENEEGRGH